jgi:hypothetical protein
MEIRLINGHKTSSVLVFGAVVLADQPLLGVENVLLSINMILSLVTGCLIQVGRFSSTTLSLFCTALKRL